MVVHGLDFHLSLPDDENLIWNGNLCWSHRDGSKPDCEEFDWLVDYLAEEVGYDKADETGDALLALSAMRGLGSPAKKSSYIKSLIRCMDATRPCRVQHAALRAIYEVRDELASITSSSMPEDINAELLNELSGALSTAMQNHDAGLDASRDLKYIHIIFAMTKNVEWCQRLTSHCHLQRCIDLVAVDTVIMHDRDVGFYLTVIIGRLYTVSNNNNIAFDSLPTQNHPWWTLIKNTWMHARYNVGNNDYINGITALVTATRSNIFSGEQPADVTNKVQEALDDLQRPDRQATFVESGVAQAAVEAAISSVKDLCDYLGRVEQPKAS
jgi:hypothetical protein